VKLFEDSRRAAGFPEFALRVGHEYVGASTHSGERRRARELSAERLPAAPPSLITDVPNRTVSTEYSNVDLTESWGDRDRITDEALRWNARDVEPLRPARPAPSEWPCRLAVALLEHPVLPSDEHVETPFGPSRRHGRAVEPFAAEVLPAEPPRSSARLVPEPAIARADDEDVVSIRTPDRGCCLRTDAERRGAGIAPPVIVTRAPIARQRFALTPPDGSVRTDDEEIDAPVGFRDRDWSVDEGSSRALHGAAGTSRFATERRQSRERDDRARA